MLPRGEKGVWTLFVFAQLLRSGARKFDDVAYNFLGEPFYIVILEPIDVSDFECAKCLFFKNISTGGISDRCCATYRFSFSYI